QHADQRKLHSRCFPDKDASSSPSPPPRSGSDTTHPPVAHAPQSHRSLSSYTVSSRPAASNAPAALHTRPDTTSLSPSPVLALHVADPAPTPRNPTVRCLPRAAPGSTPSSMPSIKMPPAKSPPTSSDSPAPAPTTSP